jgi:hypothetical protein
MATQHRLINGQADWKGKTKAAAAAERNKHLDRLFANTDWEPIVIPFPQGIMIVRPTAKVENSLFSDPFRFNIIQFVLSQGLAQQPLRKQRHKLLELLVYVAGRTSLKVSRHI